MLTCNYNVHAEEDILFFEEAFDPKCFPIHFQLDPNDDLSPMGWITFEPLKRAATMYWYGHPEDLYPVIVEYDLRWEGGAIMVAFAEYEMGDLYRAAEQFTVKQVNAMAGM